MRRRRRRIPASEQRAAIAVAYPKGEIAPKVVAKGYGDTAERIIEQAKKAGVFVHDAPELLNLLMKVDMDEHIPVELYRAIAEVLAFVYTMEKLVAHERTSFEEWKDQRDQASENRVSEP
jgi:flagellar biosynthesis protein